MENTKNKKQLEKFLLENGFEFYTFYLTNKIFNRSTKITLYKYEKRNIDI